MLEIDGLELIESPAIAEYLEETRKEPRLMPEGVKERAQVRTIMSLICSGIQPLQNPPVLALHPKDQRAKRANDVITDGFKALESLMESWSGDFAVGNSITLADTFLYPMCHSAERYKVDLTQFPTINRVFTKLDQVDEFIKGAYYSQPDCPEELRKGLISYVFLILLLIEASRS
ncbi:hypothetical protein BB560_005606, partial [Smittium megazygosporum]